MTHQDASCDEFDRALQTANGWMSEIGSELDTENPDEACRVLRAVLHTLRDRLPASEVVHLGGELPALIAGVYYEGYRLREKPLRRGEDDFLAEIRRRLGADAPAAEPLRPFAAVLKVLSRHVSDGELEEICEYLPKNLRNLWVRLEEEFSRLEWAGTTRRA
ncbi:MAG TPA: DUF2267 domain-containing protein [Candidatus Eisenbacteria bacterium]|nr:DUF2267 domain-containing protein [Candidatus Eisenbacteria bacterium]